MLPALNFLNRTNWSINWLILYNLKFYSKGSTSPVLSESHPDLLSEISTGLGATDIKAGKNLFFFFKS